MIVQSTPPDLSRLRAFAVFAQSANFTHAARALGLSQPALHAQVKALSARLGVVLYRREGRRLRITEAGQAVAAFAQDTLDGVAQLEASLRDRANLRPARLCAGEGAFLYLLGPALAQFTGVLSCQVQSPAGVIAQVQMAGADVGVVPAQALPRDLEHRLIDTVGVQLIIPSEHPLALVEGPVSPQEFAGVALVVPAKGGPLRRAIETLLEGVPWRVAVEVHGWPVALRFAELGVGVAVVNRFCPVPLGCVARPVPGLPSVRYLAIRRREGHRSATVAALWAAVTPSTP